MKTGITLLCKNEIDIIDEWMKYHLGRSSLMYVMDNVSSDGTWEYLLQYKNRILLKQQESQIYDQARWVYEMDMQLKMQGCDWVINIDADEFLQGNIQQVIDYADSLNFDQVYAQGTFMRVTDKDPVTPYVTKRIGWHDPWNQRYSNDKAILRLKGLTGVCQGCHWGYWDHDPINASFKELRLFHYETRSAEQMIKKYAGHFSPEKLRNMGEGWRAKNKLWLDGGDQALIDLYNKSIQSTDGLEYDLLT